ncbi:hypothetical protein [Shigella boydii]|uniref:hypothetical protein n=1 Tax=Shigella boydii TaxID=621 RepID=UPI0013E3699A|nr:hypothetical protein [Shigella boydii]
MTTTHIRGYIPHAPAKSGVGIGTPDIETVHTALAVFLCAKHSHIRDLWRAVWGHRKVRRMFRPVVPTLHSSPPDDWNLKVVR